MSEELHTNVIYLQDIIEFVCGVALKISLGNINAGNLMHFFFITYSISREIILSILLITTRKVILRLFLCRFRCGITDIRYRTAV